MASRARKSAVLLSCLNRANHRLHGNSHHDDGEFPVATRYVKALAISLQRSGERSSARAFSGMPALVSAVSVRSRPNAAERLFERNFRFDAKPARTTLKKNSSSS